MPPPTDGVAVSVVVPPAQIVSLFTVTVGAGLIVTDPDPIPGVQPNPTEYVTVYVPVVEIKILWVVSPLFDHRYVPPPELGVAVKVTVVPAQVVILFTLTVGAGVTVTAPVPMPGVQPDPTEYVTV